MPLCKRIPSYCLHRPWGQACVIIDGKHVYLGIYGSAQSREQYARLIAERFKPGGAAPVAPSPQHGFAHVGAPKKNYAIAEDRELKGERAREVLPARAHEYAETPGTGQNEQCFG